MFDPEEMIAQFRQLAGAPDAPLAISALLARAVADPAPLLRALPVTHAHILPLWVSDSLSVLQVVWAPGMTFRPHTHRMWAVIGLYEGQEDNAFYRRTSAGITLSGPRELRAGDVASLDVDVIHAVTNPRRTLTAAIHVYGGNIAEQPGRSEWEGAPPVEVPYDFDRARRAFIAANAAASEHPPS